MAVATLTQLDLKARVLARSWGVSLIPTVVLVPASPCSRRHCGGSVLGDGCMLCARAFGRPDHADLDRELARQPGLGSLAKAVLT